jgi:hypothetical protein
MQNLPLQVFRKPRLTDGFQLAKVLATMTNQVLAFNYRWFLHR